MSVRSSRHGLTVGLTHDGRPVRSLTSAVFARLRAEIRREWKRKGAEGKAAMEVKRGRWA